LSLEFLEISPFPAFPEAYVPPIPATFSPGMKLDALCLGIILGMTGTIGGIGRTAGIVVFVPSELVLFGAVGSMLIFLEGEVELVVELELVEFVLFETGTTGTTGKTGIVVLVPVELEVEFVVFERNNWYDRNYRNSGIRSSRIGSCI